ncbi:MAG: NTP transferase domain-containing protein [Candidatus Magasanikbacteria bacterium]|nr:NTP transferase domain-containing protein [Candidatus Magasanikbacteria bacterium]
MDFKKVGVVILAGGRGARLNCTEIPKVMCPIGDKPIISYIVDTLFQIGFEKSSISLVVGFKREKVEEYFGEGFIYAHQKEQLGTGHAAYVGMQKLPKEIEIVLVLNGDDSAFYKKESLVNFIQSHLENNATISLLTTELDHPIGYGRVIRKNNSFKIIEKEYLTEEQEKVQEISTGTFVFDRFWYEGVFPNMPKMRAINEYGIPAAIMMARDENKKIQAVLLEDRKEWYGVNKPHELEEANKRKQIK